MIILTTGGIDIPSDPKVDIHMGIVANPDGNNSPVDPPNGYDGIIGIETRGSSSSGWPKKSYSFETRNTDGSNLNISLLGMPQENDWILYGPYADKTLIRNILAFELARETNRWAPRTRLCELFLDGDYKGVYILMEKIKRDANRVDISELNPDEIDGDDLTGGYILKIDRPENYWISDYSSPIGNYPVPISCVYPDFDEMHIDQKDYIKNFMDDFEDALAGDDFMDTDLGYMPYINRESFVDFFLINELARNVDAYRLSTYFYKDKNSEGGKLTMGPLWDFNFSFGNADYYDAYKADGWMLHSVPAYDAYQAPFWWDRLREDPYFNASLRFRWESLRQSVFSEDAIDYKIDSLATLLEEAQTRNFDEYQILGTYIWPNYYIGSSYEEELNFMKEWIGERIQWMDEQLGTINTLETRSLVVNPYEIAVYPNPFIDHVQVTYYALKNCRIDIQVFDQIGRELFSNTLDARPGYCETEILMEEITSQSGLFFIRFSSEGEIIRTIKLIRQ